MPLSATHLRLLVCCLAGIGLAVGTATAQHITIGFGASGGVPQNEFHDAQSRLGMGVSAIALYGIGPIAVGVEAASLTYDHRAAPLQPAMSRQVALVGDVTRTRRIGSLHGVLRLQVPEGPVRPYVDGLAGFQRFTSVTHYEQNLVIAGTGVFWPPVSIYRQDTRSLDADDLAFSYGAGGGVLLRVARGVDAGVPFEAFLDVGARYIRGEPATYHSVAADGTTVLRRTRTDIIRPQVTLVVQFSR
jgi:hypothetical protein